MLLVYVPRLTNRLGYTLNVLLSYILHIDYQITTSIAAFMEHEGPRFSYGVDAPLADEPSFRCDTLLFETSVAPREIGHTLVGDTHAIFPVEQPSSLPFDPFAASFFMLSRYEEYLPFVADEHGRFPSSQSLAARYGFLMQAVVDRWALLVRDVLCQAFPSLQHPLHNAEFLVTVDIDAAYCYRHKGMLRTCRGLMRDALLNHDYDAVRRRIRVIMGKEDDPYDTFDYILDLAQRHPSIKPMFFVLLADYSIYDKPIAYTNRTHRQLIQHLDDYAKMGIHTSYYAVEQPELVELEMQRLSAILHRPIVRSRAHFLRVAFPDTFKTLIDARIQSDYSLGYAEEPGFRCGTCTPYPFFDLSTNQELPLMLHPFAVMDTTMRKYKTMADAEIQQVYASLVDETRRNGGTLTTLWHNQNLTDSDQWRYNRQMLEYFASV